MAQINDPPYKRADKPTQNVIAVLDVYLAANKRKIAAEDEKSAEIYQNVIQLYLKDVVKCHVLFSGFEAAISHLNAQNVYNTYCKNARNVANKSTLNALIYCQRVHEMITICMIEAKKAKNRDTETFCMYTVVSYFLKQYFLG